MKFLLDAELEKIARWLRMLGQDTEVLPGPINKKDLIKDIERIFITTSRKWEYHIKSWGIQYLIIPKDSWKVQLCMIIKTFRIKPQLKLNRCIYCNSPLMSVNKQLIKDRIPPLVYEFAYDFTICPRCSHIYWKGTHFRMMKTKLKEILNKC